jgi:outer membrane protein OmpA-like peptidoglycan-associated protein
MTFSRAPASVRVMMALGVLLAGVSGCKVLSQGHPQGTRSLKLATVDPSVLVVIVDPESVPAMRATGALVESTVRAGERIIILSAKGGALLASSKAPGSPATSVPDPPVAPQHPTSFQRARYNQALQQYRNTVSRDRAVLLRQQQGRLRAWAASLVAQAASRPTLQSTQGTNVGADLSAASSVIASMRQAGLPYGTAAVIAVMAVNQAAAPIPAAGLPASTVVVDGFPGSATEQSALQSSLVQDGAARAVVLTPATDDQLVSVVRQGLDGAITDTLTSVLFARGQYTLQPAALPQLRHLLQLLAVKYPHATATVDGYTDNLPLPMPGGNVLLSRLRAQVVRQWLIAHGITAGRLQAFGYGDTDPTAPNTASGQPLNRRVVVVIDPAVVVPA